MSFIIPYDKLSPEDGLLIHKIILRLGTEFAAYVARNHIRMLWMEMDLHTCHLVANPLRLQELLDASPYEFTHDLSGIYVNINRNTGELENSFVPRFSK